MSVIILASLWEQSWRVEKLIVKSFSHVLHKKGWSDGYLWMILGVLAITGPDSGVVGGPVYVRFHLGQSLGVVLEGASCIKRVGQMGTSG